MCDGSIAQLKNNFTEEQASGCDEEEVVYVRRRSKVCANNRPLNQRQPTTFLYHPTGDPANAKKQR